LQAKPFSEFKFLDFCRSAPGYSSGFFGWRKFLTMDLRRDSWTKGQSFETLSREARVGRDLADCMTSTRQAPREDCSVSRSHALGVVEVAVVVFALACLITTFTVKADAGAADGANDAGARRKILIVYENDPTLPAGIELGQGFRTTLERGLPAGFETYSEYLDLLRFADPENLSRRAADMRARYAGLSLDVS
jgi:hypothetical protein